MTTTQDQIAHSKMPSREAWQAWPVVSPRSGSRQPTKGTVMFANIEMGTLPEPKRDSHAALIAEIARLLSVKQVLVEALEVTASNLESIKSAAPGVRVYSAWQRVVAEALGKAGAV